MKQEIQAKDIKENMILFVKGDVYLIKFVDVGEKTVYLKGQNGQQFSFPRSQMVVAL